MSRSVEILVKRQQSVFHDRCLHLMTKGHVSIYLNYISRHPCKMMPQTYSVVILGILVHTLYRLTLTSS